MASFGSFIAISLISALSSSLAQDISSDSNTCENICVLTVNRTQAAEGVGYCSRGCRLMRLVDFANDGESSLDDLLQMCLQSCNSAYGDTDSSVIKACQSGCNAQLPFVADRRRQLAIFYQEAEQYFEMMEWLSSVMNCFSSRDRELGNKGYYVRARIVVISSAVNDDGIRGSSIYADIPAIVDEPNNESGIQDGWLDCMVESSGLSRNFLIIISGITMFMFTFFTLVVCCPVCCGSKPAFSHSEKLSIYGDGEVLKTLAEADDELLLHEKPAAEEPRVILMKIPIHSV